MSVTLTVVPRPSDDEIAGRNATKNGDIWIVPQAREHLAKLVTPDMTCFEWGAGGSTIWFARHCKHVISVENHPRWHIWTAERLAHDNLADKVRLWYAHCTTDSLDLYTDTIEAYPYSQKFDIIAPDGFMPARRRSVELALNHVKSGSIMVIDNSNRYEHKDLLRDWQGWAYQVEPVKFLGETLVWETTLYVKP